MKRYNKLTEYDPVKMRQLYQKGKGTKSKQIPEWVLELPYIEKYKKTKVISNPNYFNFDKEYRLILTNKIIYVVEGFSYTHDDLLGWLLYYGKINTDEESFFKWHLRYKDESFLCMYKPNNSNDFYFSESYEISESTLSKIKDKKFKYECNIIEKKYGEIVPKIWY